jgi:hypothetical protein
MLHYETSRWFQVCQLCSHRHCSCRAVRLGKSHTMSHQQLWFTRGPSVLPVRRHWSTTCLVVAFEASCSRTHPHDIQRMHALRSSMMSSRAMTRLPGRSAGASAPKLRNVTGSAMPGVCSRVVGGAAQRRNSAASRASVEACCHALATRAPLMPQLATITTCLQFATWRWWRRSAQCCSPRFVRPCPQPNALRTGRSEALSHVNLNSCSDSRTNAVAVAICYG